MSDKKKKFLDKLVKAQESGWVPKDKLLIPKIECLPDELFDPALDQALNKGEEPVKEEPKKSEDK